MHSVSCIRPLDLWHLLSLDAPTVAATWTWFVARTFGISLGVFELTGMFLAVWILYAADRLLDSIPSGSRDDDRALELRPRHVFHAQHRQPFAVILILAIVGLAISLRRFPHTELALDLVLGALLISWFVVIHVAARLCSLRLPKELAVGVFFAAAVFIPTLARPSNLRTSTLVPAIFFGLLCAFNGLFIHLWEHAPPSLGRPAYNDADPVTRWLLSRPAKAALFCFLVPPAVAVFVPGTQALPEYAVSLSTLALVVLNRWRQSFEQTTLRALADFALLSPLLLVPLLR